MQWQSPCLVCAKPEFDASSQHMQTTSIVSPYLPLMTVLPLTQMEPCQDTADVLPQMPAFCPGMILQPCLLHNI